MNVLVTGGAGFIGNWIIRRLLQRLPEASIINLDLLTYAGNLHNLADVDQDSRYRFVHGDIRDAELVNQLMREVDVCLHAAAETHVDRSITGPLVFTETNVYGTHVLLEAARKHSVEKFVLISTDEVYGSLPLNTPDKFTEKTPLAPSSPYAGSKAAADLMALAYYHTYDFPVCITRCGNNYGPYQYPEKLIPFFILNALEDKPLPVYGDGQNVRDWIHVRDHADAVITVMLSGQPGEVYHVGANNQQNNLGMTKLILALMGKPESMIRFVPDRPGHDRRYALETTKLTTMLQWSPQHDFASGLQETVAWYQDNTTWLQHVKQRQVQENTGPGAAWLFSGSL